MNLHATTQQSSLEFAPLLECAGERLPQRLTLRTAVLGTGTVGRALLARLDAKSDAADGRFELLEVRNSRRTWRGREAADPAIVLRALDALSTSEVSGEFSPDVLLPDAPGQAALVIDATASAALAARHVEWLQRGVHVVTASKLAAGGSLSQWRALQEAQRGGAHYGDSATVGAGLPLLSTIRRLRAGGDRIHAIAGTLSGSLAWLFSGWDGLEPFSQRLHAAQRRGYTEPDPRDDLSGADVGRKLLILARAGGVLLEADSIRRESLLPTSLALLSRAEALDALDLLDAPLAARHADARRRGRVLRHVARIDADGAGFGLEALAPDDPLVAGDGCDNRVALWSDRYRDRPLVIQGPGAGAEVTAAALIDDALAIAAQARAAISRRPSG